MKRNNVRASTITFTVAILMVLTLITISALPLPGAYLGNKALAQNSNTTNSTMTRNSNTTNSTMLTYQNPDIGLSMQYPSNWIKQTGNLVRNTIVAFELKQNQFRNSLNFVNTTLAEVDLRVYPAPANVTSANFNLGDVNLPGEAITSHYKNGTTVLGGLPAIKKVSYLFGAVTEKTMQVWTFVPSKHIFVALHYITQPPQYSLYLPAVQMMVNSIKIAH